MDANRTKALDLGSDDWTWLYELAFWLGPDDEEVTDHFEFVPAAQATLRSLLDEGLAELAEFGASQSYEAVDSTRAHHIVNDLKSWRTAQDLNEGGSPVLFAYSATEEGRQLYFGGGAV